MYILIIKNHLERVFFVQLQRVYHGRAHSTLGFLTSLFINILAILVKYFFLFYAFFLHSLSLKLAVFTINFLPSLFQAKLKSSCEVSDMINAILSTWPINFFHWPYSICCHMLSNSAAVFPPPSQERETWQKSYGKWKKGKLLPLAVSLVLPLLHLATFDCHN